VVLSPTPRKACQRGFLNGGMPLYLNPDARVNTILTHFGRVPTPREIRRRETTAQRDGGTVRAQWCEVGQGPIAHYLQPSARILAPASVATVLARVWDEALGSYEA
jgi:hypothetical protein